MTGDAAVRPVRRRVGRWLGRLLTAAVMLILVLLALREGFASLPLFVDYEGAPVRDATLAAVLVSGDMGLAAGMGHRIAERLERAGVPVLGVNSPAYFMVRRTPGEIDDLIEHAARRTLAGHPTARLVLIGQSFGADVLPVGVNRLPPDLRGRLALVVLIVPTRTAYYGISPAEYFEFGTPDARAVVEASAMRDVPVLCIRGERERQSLCPELRGPNVRRIALPGGHMLNRDAARLFAALRPAVEAQMAK
jgi:type IV secretory pathway VirJ component